MEKSLLLKLQELSEKYREAVRQNEESNAKYKQDVQKFENMQLALKDNQYYVNAVERENAFLREEIERAKYSKDKAEYTRFISGLVPIRGSKKICNDENSMPSSRKDARSPFKEVIR